MAIKKVQLPDNSTQDINDARIASTDITQWNGKEDKSNKVTSLSSSSTDTEYPSAKAVYDALQNAGGGGESVVNVTTAAANISAQVGTLYQWTVVPTSIAVSLPSTPVDTSKRIRLKFTTGGTAPSLSLPQNIAWEDDTPVVLASESIYEILISYDTVGGWTAYARRYVASYISLPTGYSLYEWIGKGENNTAYIDTGYVPKTKPILLTSLMRTGATLDADLFGFSNNSNNAYFVFNPAQTNSLNQMSVFYKYGSLGSGNLNPAAEVAQGTWYNFKFADVCEIGEQSWNWTSVWDFSNNTSSVRLFGGRNNTCKNFRIKRTKIYDGDALVRDLVPCTNSQSVAGMYDLVTEAFFTSAVSGQTFDIG